MCYPKFWMLFLLLLPACAAKTQQQEIFAYVRNSRGKVAVKEASAYKYDVVNRVYKDLLQARGDFRMQTPELTMNNGDQFVAWMDPQNIRIGIEEKAYDICTGFGPDSLNALATLLAHELTHYYEKHDWSRNFIHHNQELETAREIGALKEGIKQETQSDYLGGFLALSAGYTVYDIMPRLLRQIYQTYGLPEKLPGYPSLEERVQMSVNAQESLKELQAVFETAQYLSLLENYEQAGAYYRYILQKFQSREIYNNAGVNLALAALSLFSMTEMPYVLPLEPDPDSRLFNLKGMQADRLQKRNELLDLALEQLDRTIVLDPDYAIGYLNKACVFTLKGEWEDAAYWLSKGKKAGKNNPNPDFLALEGLIAALEKDTLKAGKLLEDAQQKGSAIAGINLGILHEKVRPRPKLVNQTVREKIDQISLDEFLLAPNVEKEINIDKNTICGIKNLAHSRILVHYENNGRQFMVMQLCGTDCADLTQKGIGVGTNASELRDAYGLAPHLVAQPDNQVWIFPDLQLLFRLDKQGLVEQWGAFRKSSE